MSNQYGLPEKELEKIRIRDKTCVYCHKKMLDTSSSNRRDWATIEHLNYLPPWNNPATVAICCGSCNSSRGQKKLMDWFKSQYCLDRNINKKTVAEPVKIFIKAKDYNC
jgi:hypothetical protein